MSKKYLQWQEINYQWNNIELTWDEVFIIIEVAKLTGNSSAYVKGNPWDVSKNQLVEKLVEEIGEEKTQKFIKVFCRVNNMEYEKITESNSNIKVTATQMQMVFNEVIKIGIKF